MRHGMAWHGMSRNGRMRHGMRRKGMTGKELLEALGFRGVLLGGAMQHACAAQRALCVVRAMGLNTVAGVRGQARTMQVKQQLRTWLWQGRSSDIVLHSEVHVAGNV